MHGPGTCVVSMQRDCLAAAQAQLQDVFAAAVKGGVTFFDTAEVGVKSHKDQLAVTSK